MRLTKRIPARTKTLRIRWLRKDFCQNTPRFRAIRGTAADPMDACYWCKHKFDDGEMMALAAVEGGANKALCQQCAEEAEQNDNDSRTN